MLSVDTGPRLGTVETIATSGRGLNPEELTRMVIGKILYVSPNLPELERLKADAHALDEGVVAADLRDQFAQRRAEFEAVDVDDQARRALGDEVLDR